jgi:hypothetical protein
MRSRDMKIAHVTSHYLRCSLDKLRSLIIISYNITSDMIIIDDIYE